MADDSGSDSSSTSIISWSNITGVPAWLSSLGDVLSGVKNFPSRLENLLTNPTTFVRNVLSGVVIGVFFTTLESWLSYVVTVFDAVVAPFRTSADALAGSIAAILNPLVTLTDLVGSAYVGVATATGPFAPIVLPSLYLLTALVFVRVLIRLVRAFSDSVPVLASIETFLFG